MVSITLLTEHSNNNDNLNLGVKTTPPTIHSKVPDSPDLAEILRRIDGGRDIPYNIRSILQEAIANGALESHLKDYFEVQDDPIRTYVHLLNILTLAKDHRITLPELPGLPKGMMTHHACFGSLMFSYHLQNPANHNIQTNGLYAGKLNVMRSFLIKNSDGYIVQYLQERKPQEILFEGIQYLEDHKKQEDWDEIKEQLKLLGIDFSHINTAQEAIDLLKSQLDHPFILNNCIYLQNYYAMRSAQLAKMDQFVDKLDILFNDGTTPTVLQALEIANARIKTIFEEDVKTLQDLSEAQKGPATQAYQRARFIACRCLNKILPKIKEYRDKKILNEIQELLKVVIISDTSSTLLLLEVLGQLIDSDAELSLPFENFFWANIEFMQLKGTDLEKEKIEVILAAMHYNNARLNEILGILNRKTSPVFSKFLHEHLLTKLRLFNEGTLPRPTEHYKSILPLSSLYIHFKVPNYMKIMVLQFHAMNKEEIDSKTFEFLLSAIYLQTRLYPDAINADRTKEKYEKMVCYVLRHSMKDTDFPSRWVEDVLKYLDITNPTFANELLSFVFSYGDWILSTLPFHVDRHFRTALISYLNFSFIFVNKDIGDTLTPTITKHLASKALVLAQEGIAVREFLKRATSIYENSSSKSELSLPQFLKILFQKCSAKNCKDEEAVAVLSHIHNILHPDQPMAKTKQIMANLRDRIEQFITNNVVDTDFSIFTIYGFLLTVDHFLKQSNDNWRSTYHVRYYYNELMSFYKKYQDGNRQAKDDPDSVYFIFGDSRAVITAASLKDWDEKGDESKVSVNKASTKVLKDDLRKEINKKKNDRRPKNIRAEIVI